MTLPGGFDYHDVWQRERERERELSGEKHRVAVAFVSWAAEKISVVLGYPETDQGEYGPYACGNEAGPNQRRDSRAADRD